jgi:hypothetical protein
MKATSVEVKASSGETSASLSEEEVAPGWPGDAFMKVEATSVSGKAAFAFMKATSSETKASRTKPGARLTSIEASSWSIDVALRIHEAGLVSIEGGSAGAPPGPSTH